MARYPDTHDTPNKDSTQVDLLSTNAKRAISQLHEQHLEHGLRKMGLSTTMEKYAP